MSATDTSIYCGELCFAVRKMSKVPATTGDILENSANQASFRSRRWRSATVARRTGSLPLAAAVLLAGAVIAATPLASQERQGGGGAIEFLGSGTVEPAKPGDEGFDTPAAPLSTAQREDLLNRLQAKREALALEAQETLKENPHPVSVDEAPAPQTHTRSDSSETHGTLIIGRNNENTRASAAGNSTLAEPAAIQNRNQVLYSGNFRHLERSTNHGSTYADLAIPAGPADAPTVCCDNDMVMDDRRVKTGFHSTLYVNASLTNGVVRIFVKRARNLGLTKCSYTIDPAGANNNILPDYPHIALSKGYLYLSINALPTTGTGFARMYRFKVGQMRRCQTTSFNTFTRSYSGGQRVWVPSEGAYNQRTIFWVHHEDSDTIRIYRWNQWDAGPTSVTRNIQASNFSNPDCRGGTGNFDFIERSTAWSIAGFRTRSTVARGDHHRVGLLAVYWHSAPIGNIPQAHVRGAVFRMSDLALRAQPHIWNSSFCFGYPAVTGNIFGDIGLTIAWGGRAGGGGFAARAGVGIDDDFTPGLGFFQTVRRTVTGVANRSDGRFGDYFTIHPYQPCDSWFGATNYAWDSSPVDTASDVNARWVEFGRQANYYCYSQAQ